ncbi:dynein axonemal assembly factor 10 isoform 2-T2 [Trichechus inunguis]
MSAFEKPQIIAHIQKSLNYTVFDCKWVPCSAKFVTMGNFARGTGVIQLYEIQHGELKLLREIEKAKPIKCGTFSATSLQQRYLATGDFGGNLHIWNLEAPEIPVYSVKGHKEIINTIDGVGGLGIGEGAPEIVTGSRDGTVKVWDPRQKDDPVANMEPVQGENKRDCWTVAFGNAYNQEERVVCAGYDNGDIKLFDLRNMSLRWETNIKNGKVNTHTQMWSVQCQVSHQPLTLSVEPSGYLWSPWAICGALGPCSVKISKPASKRPFSLYSFGMPEMVTASLGTLGFLVPELHTFSEECSFFLLFKVRLN